MSTVTGGELVVRTLLQAGVEDVFALHGAHIDAIFQAAAHLGLALIDTRHEAAAGHAAEGYARAGRRLGVALVTAGGGFTNVVTPLANAFLDRTPLLVLAGSGALCDDETNTLQAGIDQVAVARPLCKWAHRVVTTASIPRLVNQAIRIALTPPFGPVLLDLPWDILRTAIDATEATATYTQAPLNGGTLDALDVAATLDALAGAQRPVIIAGSEISHGAGEEALASLALTTGAPVFADFEGLGSLSALPAAYRGGLLQGLQGFAAAGVAPDFCLMLGIRFGLLTGHGSGSLLPRTATIYQVDPDGRELGRLAPIGRGMVASAAGAVRALASAARERSWPDGNEWRACVARRVDSRLAKVTNQGRTGNRLLHPMHASEVVAAHIGAKTVVVADGALTYLWLSEVMSHSRPARFLCHGYLGSMGVGFGVAVGAQAAARRRGERVILVTGDGAVGYSLAEFDTAVRHRLALIVVVMNNRAWGATQHFQKITAGPEGVTHTLLPQGRYDAVAEALGADGYHVETSDALDHALRQALSRDRPACIDVRVDLEPLPPEERIMMGMAPFDEE
jgi:acetolactate synthase-1/2/3 large subunit